MLSALFNDLYLGLIIALVLAVMLTGSVQLMMESALVWLLSFLTQVTSVAVSALEKTQKRCIFIYLYNYRDSYNVSPKINLLNF